MDMTKYKAKLEAIEKAFVEGAHDLAGKLLGELHHELGQVEREIHAKVAEGRIIKNAPKP